MNTSSSTRSRLALTGLVAVLAGFSTDAFAQSCAVGQVSVPFSFTGAQQSTVIPAGVTSATVFIDGAQGGVGGGPAAGAGGLGGRVSGTLAVTAGQTIFVFVGGQGSVFNGAAVGGNGGGGIGGGASDIRVGGNTVLDRVAVAGGGGGGGTTGCEADTPGGAGGVGGGGAGAAGGDTPTPGGVAGGGAGGTTGVGGAAGIGCGGFLGAPGQPTGAGGDGQGCCCFGNPRVPGGGGGGGGNVVGGGGGGGSAGTVGCSGNDKGAGGGGAGGTTANVSLAAPAITNGVNAGDGFVEICLSAAPAGAPRTIPVNSPWAILILALMLAVGAMVFGGLRRR